jgi:hypothetical protein
MENNTPKMNAKEAIALAKKALKDIGHWDNFDVERGRFFSNDRTYDYNHWLISFSYTEDNPLNEDDALPMLIVNDEEKIVTFVSWKTSEFMLSYDKEKDKYYHPTLSR